jgi:hypothetical protein
MYRRPIQATILLIACVFVLGGCNTPMTVHYTPVASVATLRSQTAPTLSVAVVRFSDTREDPQTIGSNRNLFGMRINKARTTDDLGQILAEATTDALDKAGLNADLRVDTASTAELKSSYDAGVEGRLMAINVDTRPGWNTVNGVASISVMLTVWRNGRVTKVGPITGKAQQGTMGADITNAASQSLDGALQNCIRNMVGELRTKKVFE